MIGAVGVLILLTCIHAQTVQVPYHMGGSLTNGVTTTFTFCRSGNITTVTWQQFGAEANGSGVVTTTPADAYPSGYGFSNLYRGFLPTGLTRWSYIFQNKAATVQLSNVHPVVTVLPTDASAFGAGQIVTVRAGSVTFLNADVDLNGQPGTIGTLLSTVQSTTVASTTTTTGLASSTGTTTVGQRSNSTALAVGISLPLGFLLLVIAGLSV